jgi:hypothetical protein
MGETVVADSTSARVLMWTGLPAGCAVLAWLLQLLATWLVTLEWVPFKGPLKLVDSIPAPWDTVGSLGVGLVVGLVLAAIGDHESLTVTFAGDAVRLEGMGRVSTFDREEVASVFVDRKQLVLLGRDTGELDRRPCELNRDRLAEAFRTHGYQWTDADPYAGEYRRWVPDMPGLPEGANALLAARQKRLNDLDSADAKELRGELVRLGVLVRDEKRKQYWRVVR